MGTGYILDGFPSAGAWVTYALGSENARLARLRGDPRSARRAADRSKALGSRRFSPAFVSRHRFQREPNRIPNLRVPDSIR